MRIMRTNILHIIFCQITVYESVVDKRKLENTINELVHATHFLIMTIKEATKVIG